MVVQVLLGIVSESAGVQALRHTYANVQTALQQELQALSAQRVAAPPAGTAAAAAAKEASANGGHQPHHHHHHHHHRPWQEVKPGTAAVPSCPVEAARAAAEAAAAAAAAGADSNGAGGSVSQPRRHSLQDAQPLARLLAGEEAGNAFEGMLQAEPCSASQRDRRRSGGGATSVENAAAAGAAPVAAADAAGGGNGAAAPAPAPAPAQPQPQPAAMPSSHLCMGLTQRWSGNTAMVKLIAPENRSREFGDEEEDQDPSLNIDVQYVAFRGVALALLGAAGAAAAAAAPEAGKVEEVAREKGAEGGEGGAAGEGGGAAGAGAGAGGGLPPLRLLSPS